MPHTNSTNRRTVTAEGEVLTTPAPTAGPAPPTARQLKYLGDLAVRAGRSFTRPTSAAAASALIKELRAAANSARPRRRFEDRIARDATIAGDATAVRRDEVTGYGGSCRWLR